MKKLSRSILYRYTVGEDIANSVVHGVGAILSYIGLIYLVYVASTKGEVKDVIAFSIYGTTLIFMFMMSTLYHLSSFVTFHPLLLFLLSILLQYTL